MREHVKSRGRCDRRGSLADLRSMMRLPSLFPCGTALLALLFFLLAADPGAWAQAAEALGQPPAPKSLWDSLWDLLKVSVAQSGVEASLGVVFTIVTGWLLAKKKQLESRISGPDEDLVDRADTFRQRVMVLGLGGTGKTTFIHRVTGHPGADPRRKTKDFASYSVKYTVVDPKRSRDCHLTFDDYRGQNAGDLARAINAMPVKPDYTAMVLIVDLFPAVGKTSPPLTPTGIWDRERVREHVKEWGHTSIDLVRGLSPTDFKYICLFINKYDLVTPRTAETEQAITVAFGDLIERLQARSAGVEFAVYVGSLTADIGINSVASDLIRTASDVTPRRSSLAQRLAAPIRAIWPGGVSRPESEGAVPSAK